MCKSKDGGKIMKCQFCLEKEVGSLKESFFDGEIVENMYVCKECKEKSKNNFFLICEKCGCRGIIPRNLCNISRLSTLYLVKNEIEISEVTLNTMIAQIQILRPVFTYLTSRPECGENF